MKIEYSNGKFHYFDNHGVEIREKDHVFMEGRIYEVYLTEDGELGIDATNPVWLKNGRAYPCEFGIYPFIDEDEVYLTNTNLGGREIITQ